MAGLKVITPPAGEPVTLADLKLQLKYELGDNPDLDNTLRPLITAAREWCEGFQNRAYVQQTLELALDEWPCKPIEIPRPPLQSVTSVICTDNVGDLTTWASSNYLVDDYAYVARLVKKQSVSWPSVCLADINGIKIRYVAGSAPVAGEIVTGEALGTGDVTAQTFTVEHYPIVKDSETVKFNGVATDLYTIDYELGEVNCTPEEDVVVTIDYTEVTDYGANVPEATKQAIILYAMAMYDSPGCPPPEAVKSLLWMDRVVPI